MCARACQPCVGSQVLGSRSSPSSSRWDLRNIMREPAGSAPFPFSITNHRNIVPSRGGDKDAPGSSSLASGILRLPCLRLPPHPVRPSSSVRLSIASSIRLDAPHTHTRTTAAAESGPGCQTSFLPSNQCAADFRCFEPYYVCTQKKVPILRHSYRSPQMGPVRLNLLPILLCDP